MSQLRGMISKEPFTGLSKGHWVSLTQHPVVCVCSDWITSAGLRCQPAPLSWGKWIYNPYGKKSSPSMASHPNLAPLPRCSRQADECVQIRNLPEATPSVIWEGQPHICTLLQVLKKDCAKEMPFTEMYNCCFVGFSKHSIWPHTQESTTALEQSLQRGEALSSYAPGKMESAVEMFTIWATSLFDKCL